MKKIIYILLAGILGFLVATLIHSLLEIWYINLLIADFKKYSFGLSWQVWFMIHTIIAGVLGVFSTLIGIRFGIRWWQIIYVEKQYPWKRWFLNYKKPAI